MSKLTRCSQRTKREWAATVDRCTPQERRLLDRLEKVRPDMAPLKISGGLVTPLPRTGGLGVYFSYGPHMLDWVRREIKRVQAENRREYKREAERLVGAFI